MVPFDGGSPCGGSGAGNGGAVGFGSDGPGASGSIGWMEKANQASSVVPVTATVAVKPEA